MTASPLASRFSSAACAPDASAWSKPSAATAFSRMLGAAGARREFAQDGPLFVGELRDQVDPGFCVVDSATSDEFLGMLDAAAASDDPAVHLVITLRSDFMTAFQQRRDIQALLGSQRSYAVGPMRKEAMRSVINEPAKLGGVEFEDGLVDLLLDDTGGPDGLPLLAFTLRALWDRGHDDEVLDKHEYEDLGGLSGAVAHEADAVLATVKSDSELDGIAAAFVSMSRLGGDGGYARVTTRLADHPDNIHDALHRFVDKRILVAGSQDGVQTLEIAHEALFRSWKPLVGWLDANTQTLTIRKKISEGTLLWLRDHDEDDLLRGNRLTLALSLLQEGVRLTPEQVAFLDESRRSEANRATKEGDLVGALLFDPTLRDRIEPKLRQLIEADRDAAEQRRQDSKYAEFDSKALQMEQDSLVLENVASGNPRWHPKQAVIVANAGPQNDYTDVLKFPCCSIQVYGEWNQITQFRSDGCQPFDPETDAPDGYMPAHHE